MWKTTEQKFIRSPLRYPRGKSRARKFIMPLFPKSITKVVSPFLGGGSIELALACLDVDVYAYDIYVPLIVCWNQILEYPCRMYDKIQEYGYIDNPTFNRLKNDIRDWNGDNELDLAVKFWIVNHTSFSGCTLSGGRSPAHADSLKQQSQYLLDFDYGKLTGEFIVSEGSFEQSLSGWEYTFAYLDPPYMIDEALYGDSGSTHTGFDHKALRDILGGRDKWILSYNNSEEIRKLYEGYGMLYPSWSYGTSNVKGKDSSSKEIIIYSKDLEKREGINSLCWI